MLAGCAQLPMGKLDVAGINRKLDDYVCGAPDDPARTGAGTDDDRAECVAMFYDRDHPNDVGKARMRQLRAHLVVAVLARYGAARLASYSDDPASDASRILSRVEAAEIALGKLRELTADSGARRYFYEPARVDALIAIVDLAEAASRPTRLGLAHLAVLSTPGERLAAAPEILKNALKDRLYLDAYRQSLVNLARWVRAHPEKFEQAWWAIDDQLEPVCENLAAIAKTQSHCVVKIRSDAASQPDSGAGGRP